MEEDAEGMKTSTWFQNTWDSFRSNFWFLPALMSFGAMILCLLLLAVDRRIGFMLPFTGAGSLDSMRSILAVLIGALVTALSIAFSSTVVVLTLAASQLGPRLLRIYVRDRSNQILIGIFSSTVFYNLTALFVVGRLDDSGGVPNLTILGAFGMTCAALFVLIYFIHHVARSIQAPNVILSVAAELRVLILSTYPDQNRMGDSSLQKNSEELVSQLPLRVGSATSSRSGYVQAVDLKNLLDLAVTHSCTVRALCRPGDFVMEGEELADIHGEEPLDEATYGLISSGFIVGNHRTATQDVEFVLAELVEIAVRALSPGINDPFTAGTCVDRLTEALRLLSERGEPNLREYDNTGKLRLLIDHVDFDRFCDTAYHQIRQHASSEPSILIHLVESFEKVMLHTKKKDQRQSLWRHACMVQRAGERLAEPDDRADVDRRFQHLETVFKLLSGKAQKENAERIELK